MTESFDHTRISGDPEVTIKYLRSLNGLFELVAKTDFGVLQAHKYDLNAARDSWINHQNRTSLELGEFELILASLELRSADAEDISARRIHELLSSPHAIAAVKAVYVPRRLRGSIGRLEFHRAGTTSFIFVSTLRGHRMALKVVAAPYCFDTRITNHTANYVHMYKDLFESSEIAVTAHECGGRFVLMDFAPGEELSTYCSRWSHTHPTLTARISLAHSIVNQIFKCLKTMESLSVVHQDLNPKNIICANTGDSISLRIIDFGRNYVLTEGLGSAARIQRVAEYVAPELQATDPVGINITTDLYSVGRILLDILRPQEGPGVSRSERLKGLYQETPSLGGIVEDLMSPAPDFRARGCELGEIAGCTFDRLVASFEVASKLDGRDGEMSLTLRRGIVPALTGSLLSRVRQLRAISKLRTKNDESAVRNSAFLFRWAMVVWFGFMLGWVLFVALTLRDIGLGWGPFSLSIVLQHVTIPADRGSFTDNLPGRLVILSFVTISADYYMNIFSGVSFWSFPWAEAKLTDIWIRFAAVSCLPLAIYVDFWNPQSWALCSALGTLVIVINNVLTYRICLRLLNAPTRHGPVRATVEAGRADLEDFFRFGEFGSWASLMFYYSVGLFGVGLLLYFHVAHDTWVYATLFICLNILKIEASNCTAQAPKVRGNVARVIGLGWRAINTSTTDVGQINIEISSSKPVPAETGLGATQPKRAHNDHEDV